MRPNKCFTDCHERFSRKSTLRFSEKTNGLVYFAKDWLKMIFITYFRVKYHSKMFMSCRWVYQSLIRIDMWVKKNRFFLLNIISCACLAGSGLNFVFHWKAHSLIFSSSWLRSFAEASMSWTTENKDVSSANNLQLLLISFDKSMIYIKNSKGPNMTSCGTRAWISA